MQETAAEPEKDPAAQEVQAAVPMFVAYLPSEQAEHPPEPAAEYQPATQLSQAVIGEFREVGFELKPAAHMVQLVAPVVG